MGTSVRLAAARPHEDGPKCPGTVYNNNGRWYWRVKLPGAKSRKAYPLKMPGSARAMSAEKPFSVAEQAAWREWEKAVHTERRRPCGATVNDICDAWTAHANEYYRRIDGTTTSGAKNAAIDVRIFRDLFGTQYIADLTHADMLTHRDALVRSGICRSSVNKRIGCVKRMLKWALNEAMIPALLKAELSQVENLKAYRSAAHETEPVRPVDDATLDATLRMLAPNTAAMVRVHRLTGMRPEEVVSMTWAEIDTSSTPWVYRPVWHKNKWRNQPRAICIGPRARAILEPIRALGGDRPFSPERATAERMAIMRAARKTPVQPSQADRSSPDARRVPGDEWSTDSYRRAVSNAARSAKVQHWNPNQLRHAFATQVRRAFGLEATRAVLGHSAGARITDRYSYDAIEDEMIRAASPAVEALG